MERFGIGNFIRELRIEYKYTQRTLASELGLSHQDVQAWEDGRAVPNDETFKQLSELFHVSVEELKQGKLAQEKEADPDYEQLISVLKLIVAYCGFVFALLGLSLYINHYSHFIIHILVVVFGTVLLGLGLRFLHSKSKWRLYAFVTFVIALVVCGITMFNPSYYSIKQEEYLRITGIKEHVLLTPLGRETNVVLFGDDDDWMYAMIYNEEEPDVDVVVLNDYMRKDIFTISTNDELVVDVVFHWGYVYMSTMSDEYNQNTIYKFDPNTFNGEVVFQDDDVHRLYTTSTDMYMVSHPVFSSDVADIYLYNEQNGFSFVNTFDTPIWDLRELSINQSSLIASVSSGRVADQVMMMDVVLIDSNLFMVEEVFVRDLQDPLVFDHHRDIAFGFNDQSVYRFDGLSVVEIGPDGDYIDFQVLDENLYRLNHTFINQNFIVIQGDYFFDENYEKVDASAYIFPDSHGNFYALDNEYIGFVVQMPSESYIWCLPFGIRITYMVISVLTLGLFVMLGQKKSDKGVRGNQKL